MPTPLQPQSVRNIGVYGVIRESEVDPYLIPDGAVTEAVNFHFDRRGAATVRPGLTTLGATIIVNTVVFGLHNAQSGTALAVISNGSTSAIYSFNSSTWAASLDGGTASVRIRFLDFGSYTIALNFNYNTYTSMRFWNAGSSRHWHHTGNPINPQNMWGYAPQLGEVFKSRVYLFGDTSKEGNPSRLFFSSVISSTGNITFSPTVDFVDINPGDGEGGSGLKRYSLELLCFKPNYIYRFRTSGVDPDPLVKVGTRSQESIVEGKRGLYFHHDSGFYRYSGGYPELISLPMNDVVQAIPYSQFDSIEGWNDDDHIYWSIGTVTVAEARESVTYKNATLRYSESTEVWTLYSYSNDLRAGMTYTRDTTRARLVGTDHGVVATFNAGTADFGEPIKYRLRTKWYEWEMIYNRKVLDELVAVCERAQAMQLMYQYDEDLRWFPIGQIKDLAQFFRNQGIRFRRIRFQVTGMSRNEAPVFRGLEIIKGTNEGIVN